MTIIVCPFCASKDVYPKPQEIHVCGYCKRHFISPLYERLDNPPPFPYTEYDESTGREVLHRGPEEGSQS